jgi:8-oxo-dGTP pyrophosphatase MutT (NUDIX family)
VTTAAKTNKATGDTTVDAIQRQIEKLDIEEEKRASAATVTRMKVGHHLKTYALSGRASGDVALLVMVNKSPGGLTDVDLMGGKREVGESCFDAGLRETLEETGLLVAEMAERGGVLERDGEIYIDGVVFWRYNVK